MLVREAEQLLCRAIKARYFASDVDGNYSRVQGLQKAIRVLKHLNALPVQHCILERNRSEVSELMNRAPFPGSSFILAVTEIMLRPSIT